MGSWTNNDGLTLGYGQTENYQKGEGEYRTDGLFRVEEFVCNATDLTTTPAIISQQIFPWGKVLEKVEVIADQACTSGGAAVLNVGFRNLRTGAAIDTQGGVNALPLSNLNAEGLYTTLTRGSTGAGNLVGTQVAATKGTVIGITAWAGTAVYTGGRIRVRLFWYKKLPTN